MRERSMGGQCRLFFMGGREIGIIYRDTTFKRIFIFYFLFWNNHGSFKRMYEKVPCILSQFPPMVIFYITMYSINIRKMSLVQFTELTQVSAIICAHLCMCIIIYDFVMYVFVSPPPLQLNQDTEFFCHHKVFLYYPVIAPPINLSTPNLRPSNY